MPSRTTLLTFLALLLLASGVGAQIPEGVEGTFRPHPEAEKAIARLLSPFCPGFMLSQCPAAESLALRDSLQALAMDGWNADALEAWMLSRHGEEYRAVPKRSGAGLLAWLLPPMALLLGVGLVGWALRSFVARRAVVAGGEAAGAGPEPGSGPGAPGAELPSDVEEERLREAIRDLEFSEDPVY
jgi:cytochrome c-type biogenesis protein CcmH/NrfF